MSVLIRNMELPKSCAECGVKAETNCFVDYKWLLDHPAFYEERLSDCPLIEVPKHGRLIDGDAMKTRIDGSDYHTIEVVKQWIDEQPTIIESEE